MFLVCAETGDLRLGRGVTSEDGNAMYGRLEIFSNGGWGTVCDIEREIRQSRGVRFNSAAITLACAQMGFDRGMKTVLPVRAPTGIFPLPVGVWFHSACITVCYTLVALEHL